MSDPMDQSRSSSQRAVDELRELIFRGDLAAGSNHLESELAKRLNMSRTPVREAALTLEAQGLLELKPRKGVRIMSVTPEDMREVYEVLTALESMAAANAAKAGYGQGDLSGLTQAIDDMDAALGRDDLRAWADADDRFHAELVRLGANSRASAIVSMMADQVRRARAMTLFMRPRPHKSNQDHRNVLVAILQGDPDAAYRLHHAHRVRAQTMLLDLLEQYQLRQL